MEAVLDKKSRQAAAFPGDAEIVLELPPSVEEEPVQCYYYCVNHQERIIFWMDKADLCFTLKEVRLGRTESRAHISTSCESRCRGIGYSH
jgi:hypothetical protein